MVKIQTLYIYFASNPFVCYRQIRFPCAMCNKQMNTKAELRKHMSKMHAADSGNNQYDQKYTSQGMFFNAQKMLLLFNFY